MRIENGRVFYPEKSLGLKNVSCCWHIGAIFQLIIIVLFRAKPQNPHWGGIITNFPGSCLKDVTPFLPSYFIKNFSEYQEYVVFSSLNRFKVKYLLAKFHKIAPGPMLKKAWPRNYASTWKGFTDDFYWMCSLGWLKFMYEKSPCSIFHHSFFLNRDTTLSKAFSFNLSWRTPEKTLLSFYNFLFPINSYFVKATTSSWPSWCWISVGSSLSSISSWMLS